MSDSRENETTALPEMAAVTTPLELTPDDELFVTILEKRLKKLHKDKHTLTYKDLFAGLTIAREVLIQMSKKGEQQIALATILKNLYQDKNLHEGLKMQADNMLALIGSAEEVHEELARKDIDFLTGAFNRTKLENDLSSLLDDRRKTSAPFALLMIDLDKFKSINDTYGHVVGDEVLATVAQAIRGAFREGDKLYRYGGDEFMIIATTTLEGGKTLGKKVLQSVRSATVILEKGTTLILEDGVAVALEADTAIQTSCSIGVVVSSQLPENNRTPKALKKLVDDAFYTTKRNEKNNVQVTTVPQEGFEPPTPSSEDLRSIH